jgi:hypothetical protein
MGSARERLAYPCTSLQSDFANLSVEEGGDEVKQGAILRAEMLWGFLFCRNQRAREMFSTDGIHSGIPMTVFWLTSPNALAIDTCERTVSFAPSMAETLFSDPAGRYVEDTDYSALAEEEEKRPGIERMYRASGACPGRAISW